MSIIPKPKQVIRHRMYRDVAFLVNSCFDVDNKYEVKGWWLNLGFENSWPIDQAKIYIEKKDLKDWLYCTDPEAKCLRYEKWIE